jgi:DNA-binding response OmpR family regulator
MTMLRCARRSRRRWRISGTGPPRQRTAAAALTWLSRHRADAVLLDLRMPGMDGMEVLARIRAQPGARPVAVLTAVPTSDNTIEAMRLGAVDHLAKPIGRDGCRRCWNACCPRRRWNLCRPLPRPRERGTW